jgi:hypothetical protein
MFGAAQKQPFPLPMPQVSMGIQNTTRASLGAQTKQPNSGQQLIPPETSAPVDGMTENPPELGINGQEADDEEHEQEEGGSDFEFDRLDLDAPPAGVTHSDVPQQLSLDISNQPSRPKRSMYEGGARVAGDNPEQFINQYLSSSRLHYLSTWGTIELSVPWSWSGRMHNPMPLLNELILQFIHSFQGNECREFTRKIQEDYAMRHPQPQEHPEPDPKFRTFVHIGEFFQLLHPFVNCSALSCALEPRIDLARMGLV